MPKPNHTADVHLKSAESFDDHGGKCRCLTIVAVVVILNFGQLFEAGRNRFPELFTDRCPDDVSGFDLVDFIGRSSVIPEDPQPADEKSSQQQNCQPSV